MIFSFFPFSVFAPPTPVKSTRANYTKKMASDERSTTTFLHGPCLRLELVVSAEDARRERIVDKTEVGVGNPSEDTEKYATALPPPLSKAPHHERMVDLLNIKFCRQVEKRRDAAKDDEERGGLLREPRVEGELEEGAAPPLLKDAS